MDKRQNHPWEVGENLGDATPVRILGNLWFVGTRPASTHIIDTGEGLVMLDSGYRQSLPLVLSHMREMGLHPTDIRYIVHTHGHIDHMGATAELVRMTGAKTFLGRDDRAYANGTLDLTYAKELGMVWDDPFEPDVLLDDGDTISLGNLTIRCIATPGHTPGCMSYFFQVQEDGKAFRVGLHGGMGINTMCRSFLDKYGLPYSLRDRFFHAMDRLASEPVDIFLGNHMYHNHTPEKTERVLAGEKYAFVDKEEWRSYALWCKDNLANMIEKEAEV